MRILIFNLVLLGSIQNAAGCILLGDAGRLANNNPYYLCDWNQDQSDNGVPPYPLHNDGANLAFCDGHVKWLAKTKYGNFDTTAGAPAPDPSLWTP